MTKTYCIGAMTLGLLGLTSCSLGKIATPAKPTGFIASTGVDTSSKIRRVPFDHSWSNPNVRIGEYKHIVIGPVTTAYLRKDQWMDSYSVYVPSQSAYVTRCGALARNFTASLKSAFSSPQSTIRPTESRAQTSTMILEVALTEVTFGQPEG